jgi:hypothetical protein
MLQTSTLSFLISGMGSTQAGQELINAIQTQAQLSASSFKRLETCFGENDVAQNFQNCILGSYSLSARDLEFVKDGFELPVLNLADVLANLAGGVAIGVPIPNSGAENVSMPTGFSASTSFQGPSQQPVIALAMPAGSTFPNYGAGLYFTIATAGNTNQYYVWYNVTGGTNSDPVPAGLTGIEVTIGASDNAATVATKTQTAIAAGVSAAASSVAGSTVTVIPVVVTQAAALPTFSVPAGTYGSTQTITLSSATPGSSIYYTVNGSQPSVTSTLYSGPITVSASEQIKSISIKDGFANSIVNSAIYVIGGSQVATPTMSPIAGTYPGNQNVTVSSLTAGASFWYTLNGSTPTTSSTPYTGAILINQSETLKVLATKAGLSNSNVGSAAYTISAIGPTLPSLGAASTYRILAESGISTTSGTTIVGNLGVSPIGHTSITGFTYTPDLSATFGTATEVTGDIYTPDNLSPTPANLTTAVTNMGTAFTNSNALTPPTSTNPGSGALGGLTLTGGVYALSVPTTIAGDLTLSGGVSDTFVFQISSTFNMATSSRIVMSGGALASNVYWAVSGAATIGVSAVFRGVLLGSTNIACDTSAVIHGQLFAGTAVTLQSNTISS